MAEVSQNQTQDDNNFNRTNNNPTKTEGRLPDVVVTASPESFELDKPNKRQYNPLSKFSSVTYRISLYALNADSYNSYFVNGKWLLKDMELLVQSAGAPVNSPSTPKNKFFDLDFFIDNLEITTLTNGKESMVAGNVSNVKFQIIEPYAMSFPSRLVAAQEEAQKKAKIKRPIENQTDALLCPYLLVVRFYGYDENGNVVTKPIDAPATPSYTKTDSTAAFERAFPIVLTKMSFKLENKATVYDIEAKMLNEQIGYSLKRGVIPKPMSIVADTVANALGGQDTKPGQTKGLFDVFNNLQKEHVSPQKGKPKQKIADVYKVVFAPNSTIGSSSIVNEDFYTKAYTPTTLVDKVQAVNDRTAYFKSQTIKKELRQINLGTGLSVLGAIDQIIGQSTYLRDSMVFFDKEETAPTKPEESTLEDTKKEGANTKKGFQWYIVKPQVKIIDFDPLRNDYAYEITYLIQPYSVPYLRSLALQLQTGYYGPSKVYKYWYTGQNTEVLAYEMSYNLLYFNTQVLSSEGGLIEENSDSAPNAVLPATNSNPMGKLPGTNELQNTVKTFLYSPADQLKANIKILGDPDFLMPVEAGSLSDALNKWYGPDYSINANTGQVFIEIGFNEVQDYNIQSGLLEPKNNVKFWNYTPDIEVQSEGRMIYMVTRVSSKFNNGVFTQDLKSVLPDFAKTKNPSSTNKTAREKVSTAEEKKANIVSTIQKNAVSVNTSNASPGFTNSSQNAPPPVAEPQREVFTARGQASTAEQTRANILASIQNNPVSPTNNNNTVELTNVAAGNANNAGGAGRTNVTADDDSYQGQVEILNIRF